MTWSRTETGLHPTDDRHHRTGITASRSATLRRRVAGLCSALLAGLLLGGCAVSMPLIGGFSDEEPERRAVQEAKQAETVAEPSFADRLSALWDRATSSSDDDAVVQAAGAADSFDAAEALSMVNAYRQKNGLPPLSMDAKLKQAAQAHARDLAENDRISHFGSDGSDPWERVTRAGFEPKVAAENVGTGQLSFGEVLREWQLSPDHKKNLLLPDATHMGVAVVNRPDTQFKTFWSLVLGAPT